MHALDNGICVTCRPKHVLVDGQCATCSARRNFNPNEPRDPHSGKWTSGGAILHAVVKLGKSSLRLDHHGDGNITMHDEHGGSLHLTPKDIRGRGGFSGMIRDTEDVEIVGHRTWMTRYETRNGKPWSVVVAGLEKTHVAQEGDPGVPKFESLAYDRYTLHLTPDGKGLDDPAELFARPGTPMSGAEVEKMNDTLDSFAHVPSKVDTGHGSVAMHVVGAEYTLDPGGRSKPIVLTRPEAKKVDKAFARAIDAYDGEAFNRDPLPPGERFQETVQTAHGDIVITRDGPGGDIWIESDTTAIQISPDGAWKVSSQFESMIDLGPDLKHLTKA